MKRILIILVLLFSSSVVAGDIRDLQIEEMSVGDSLLDYFSEKEINDNSSNKQKSQFEKFSIMDSSLLKDFNGLQIVFESPLDQNSLVKLKDKSDQYIIHSITGGIYFPDKIDECKDKKNEVVSALTKLFDNPEISNVTKNHQQDKSGKSKVFGTYFYFDSTSIYSDALVQCTDWDKALGLTDYLGLQIKTHEYSEWISKNSSVVAKEYQSIHGFKASIPNNYLVVTSNNVDEVTETIKTLVGFDMDYWASNLILGLTHLNMEVLFTTNNFNHIIFLSMETPSYIEFDATRLSSVCTGLTESFNDSAQGNVEQIDCKISSTPGIVGNSIYAEHYGMLPGVTAFQYVFYIDSENLVVAVFLCFSEDCVASKLVFDEILLSIKE